LNDGEPKRLVDAALEKFGRVDVVVNGVGGSIANEDLLDTTEENWHRHLELNLMVATRVTRAAPPGMIEAGKGPVVSSVRERP
jgi:meso-butanediol dehydrogenase/(S,S)-butanediol dehydrogenase/diacetyl reductase